MDRLDLTQAALQALQPSTRDTAEYGNHAEARSVRGRIIGVLIRKSRFEAERRPAECAEFVGTTPQLIEAWEYGDSVPSWPQLELLALFLNGRSSVSRAGALTQGQRARKEYLLLRQRLIGALLRSARRRVGWNIDELSERSGLEAGLIKRFEFGEEKIPVSDLAALAQFLKTDLSFFTALAQTPSNLMPSNETRELSTESNTKFHQFAGQSENRAFINLAMAFKQIAPADLHRIADALFAIIRAKGDSNGRSGSPS